MAQKELLNSFKQFTKGKRYANRKCRACALPPDLLDAVNDLIQEGNSLTFLSRWLEIQGHQNITAAVLQGHRSYDHAGRNTRENNAKSTKKNAKSTKEANTKKK